MDSDEETDSIIAIATQIVSDTLLETSNINNNLENQINSKYRNLLFDSDNEDIKKICFSRVLRKRKQHPTAASRSLTQSKPASITINQPRTIEAAVTSVLNNKQTKKPRESLNVDEQSDLPIDLKRSFIKFSKTYDDLTFQTQFKVTKTTFEALLRTVNPYISAYVHKYFKNELAKLNLVLSSLWTLTTNESTRAIATRFNLKKSRCHRWFVIFCKAIFDNQTKFGIQWPGSKENQYRTIEQFNKLGDEDGIIFPNICGILGCTSLSADQQSAVRLQCLCDANGLFLDCFISYTADYSNSMIFQQSKLFERLETDPKYPLPGSQLIANEAYPLRRYLYVPYKHSPLSQKQKSFNNNLMTRKQIIDNAFLQLKQRFIKLKYLSLGLFRDQQQYVVTACALHNFCIQQGDTYDSGIYQKIHETDNVDTVKNEVTTDDDLTVEINRTNFLRLIK